MVKNKTSLFDVQVHRGGGSTKAGGLDQTFSKFREGRFDTWPQSAKPAARDDVQVNRFKDDGFDTRAYDARAQGYLGARQAASIRASVENPINLDDLESRAIQEALETCRGNVSAAARMLGISRNTIYRRLNAK
nr:MULTISPECIES: helix-turn-helix domain-containing protein [unclassified Limnobacter]